MRLDYDPVSNRIPAKAQRSCSEVLGDWRIERVNIFDGSQFGDPQDIGVAARDFLEQLKSLLSQQLSLSLLDDN